MTRQGSPERLRSRAGVLERVEATPLRDLAAWTSAAWCVCRPPAIPPYAGAVVIGGIKRGSRVVTLPGLDDIARNAVLVSPDYPIQLRADSWRGLKAVRTLVGMRPAALDSVSEVLLLTEYLSRRPDVDPQRIF